MQDRVLRNTLDTMPLIPYGIIERLIFDKEVEDLWKAIKYPQYDCLNKPNLKSEEKIEMVCVKDLAHQENYNVFLSPLIGNMISEQKTILKIYKVKTGFERQSGNMFSIGSYRFDILYGDKSALLQYQGKPVNRGDFIEMMLLKSLNGVAIKGGAGYMEFNPRVAPECGSLLNLGNNTSFVGTSMIMAIRMANLIDSEC